MKAGNILGNVCIPWKPTPPPRLPPPFSTFRCFSASPSPSSLVPKPPFSRYLHWIWFRLSLPLILSCFLFTALKENQNEAEERLGCWLDIEQRRHRSKLSHICRRCFSLSRARQSRRYRHSSRCWCQQVKTLAAMLCSDL